VLFSPHLSTQWLRVKTLATAFGSTLLCQYLPIYFLIGICGGQL
jgi:hypothetical protein